MTIAGHVKAALFARLQEATLDNGYATDMGLHAHRGLVRSAEQDLDTGPAVVLTTPEENVRDRSGHQQRITLMIEVVAAARADTPLPDDIAAPVHPADVADALLGDIKRALLRDTELRIPGPAGTLTQQLEYVSSRAAMPDPGEQLVTVAAVFRCAYFERYGSPTLTA